MIIIIIIIIIIMMLHLPLISSSAPSCPHTTDRVSSSSSPLVTHPTSGKEHGVDEDLHARVLKVVVSADSIPTRIILVTGDGNDNGGGSSTNFLECVQLALSKGLAVEMWAWSSSCNRGYVQLQKGQYSAQFKLSYLDNFGF
jgi:hypothetical protein